MAKLTISDKFALTIGLLKGYDVGWSTEDAIAFLEDRAAKAKPKSKESSEGWLYVKDVDLEDYNLVCDYLLEVDYPVNAECVSENCGLERWRASNILNYFADHGVAKTSRPSSNDYTMYELV